MKGTADVVVVGGGIIGCATAAELARAGAAVVLVERGPIAAGASGRNHGLIFTPEDPGLRALAGASMARYRELAAESSQVGIGLDAEPVGLLVAVTQDHQWEAARREAAGAARGGRPVEYLDAAGARAAEPALGPGVLGGYLIGDGYRVDPAALTLALAYRARASGAEVATHTEAKQVLAPGGRVRGLATDAGVITTEIVVDAAGPWAAKLARSVAQPLPIGGVRGWLLLTAARPGLMHHLVVSAGWHLPGRAGAPGPATVAAHGSGAPVPRDVGTLVQQNPDQHILLGGSRAPSLDADGFEEASATT
ncbi:MAG TPA: FAD-dependent oxidoreductase, partial [Actinomycetota bacterium]|nr:FAD-dependent oxidoreductase [Actinomycetota bacterium]